MDNNHNTPQIPLQLADRMENIINQVKDLGLCDDTINEIREDLDVVNSYLETTDTQSIIFITILEESFDSMRSIQSLAKKLGISNIRFMHSHEANVRYAKLFC